MATTDELFSGIARSYGTAGLARLVAGRVLVVGVGGVGSWTVEALARSGVGTIALVDMDDVCTTNTNRQLHALSGSYGRLKVEVLAERVRLINPHCRVEVIPQFFTKTTAAEIFSKPYDWVVDSIDSAPQKSLLIATAVSNGSRVVTVGGVGGLRDATLLQVTDLNRTQNDKLLFWTRKKLRQSHGWPRGSVDWGVPAVFSSEMPTMPECESGQEPTPVRMGCETGYGALTFVTGTAGFLAAGVVVDALAAGP